MIEFAYPQYLYLLWSLSLGVLAILFALFQGKKLRTLFASRSLSGDIMPERSTKRNIWRYAFLLLSFCATIIMMAGPRWNRATPFILSKENMGIDLVFCIDISNSMKAQDLAPNRISFAKQVATQVTNRMQGSRIGVVVFAGSAFIRTPLTSDIPIVKEMIADISPEIISQQGTDIASALRLASGSLSQKGSQSKAIILLTDGEDHEGGVEEAIKEIIDKKIRLYTIAIGSEVGATIPSEDGTLKDVQGTEVVSKVNLDMIKHLSDSSNGQWFMKQSARDMSSHLIKVLESLPKANLGSTQVAKLELFPLFAVLAILFLLLSQVVMPRKSRLFYKVKLF